MADNISSTRLVAILALAEAEKQKALAAEPWAEVASGLPAFNSQDEPISSEQAYTAGGIELFGVRLALDIVGGCTDQCQVEEKLDEWFSMIGDPGHLRLVVRAALEVIGNYLVPALCHGLDQGAAEDEARVLLADAAHSAWAARVRDLGGDGVAA